VSIDEQHVALPKLYGAPAYARPPAPVATVPRPFDPDDLPIEELQTDDERAFAASLPARAWAQGGTASLGQDGPGSGRNAASGLRPRALSLRAIAGRLLGDDKA